MEEFQYCRACLASDVKMYSLDHGEYFCTSRGVELKADITMGNIYSQVVQIPEPNGKQNLCFYCAALLGKFHRFKSRCHQVHDILHKLETAGLLNELTSEKIIKSIDRKLNNLETYLQLSPIEILSCDPLNGLGEPAYELKQSNIEISNMESNKCNIDGKNSLKVDQIPKLIDSSLKVIVNELVEKDNKGEELLKNDESMSTKNENNKDPLQEIDESNILFANDDNKMVKNVEGNDMSDNYEDDSVLMDYDEDSNKNYFIDNYEDVRILLENYKPDNKNAIIDNLKDASILLGNDEHGNKIYFEDNDEDDYYILVKDDDDNYDNDSANNSDSSESNHKKRSMSMTSDYDNFDTEFNELSIDKFDLDDWYYGNEITVTYLSLAEAKKRMLLRKRSKLYTMPEYKCNTCYIGFKTKIKLDSHMEKHNEACGEHICILCQLRYPTRLRYRKHLLGSHMRKYVCNLCSFHCFSFRTVRRHIIIHKKREYPCTHCSEIFCEPISLSTHMKRLHPDIVKKESVCEFCGKGLATLKGLMVHKRKVHKQTDKKLLGPKCEECNTQFATKKAWEQHFARSSNHGGRKCIKCGEVFQTEKQLKEHLKKHPLKFKLVRYECDMCGIHLRAQDFEPHVTTVHVEEAKDLMKKFEEKRKALNKESPKKDFVCEICGKMIVNSHLLAIHTRTHTGERPFKCQLCDEAFLTSWTLKAHMIVHSEVGAWKCETCGKPFKSYQARDKHVKIVHLESRPHKCPRCGKRFPYVCTLRTHIKYTHDNVPWPKRIRNRKNVGSSETDANEEQ